MSSTLTDDDRDRMTKFVIEAEQQSAMDRVAIHEASHAVVYWHLADDETCYREDAILTLLWNAGDCRGCCVTPLLPGRLNAVKSIAGIVGESVIELQGVPSAEQFQQFCESDFVIPATDPVAFEHTHDKRNLATEAANILLAHYLQVQLVAHVLMNEAAIGRSLFQRMMRAGNTADTEP